MPVNEFTYTFNPSGDTRDAVRFLLGDTQKDAPLLDDQEIAYALTANGNNARLAAAQCAEAVAALLSRTSGMQADGVRFASSADYYLKLAQKLRLQAAAAGGAPYAGGIGVSDKELQEEDTDRVSPSFARKSFVPKSDGLVGSTTTNTQTDEL